MFFPNNNIESIFDTLHEIEMNLQNKPTDHEKETLINSLLNLRALMDQYVKHWLAFEEKVNKLQKQFNFNLPDVLPEGFLQDIELEPKRKSTEKILDEKLPLKKYSFLKLESEQGINSFRKGLGFWDLAMLGEAIREFEKVIELEPNFIFGHFCLGLAYGQKGLSDKAISKLRLVRALSKDSQLNAFVYNSMGNIYAGEKKYDEALSKFTRAIEEDPNFYNGYFNAGAICFNQRRYNEAIEYFEKARDALPADWEINYCLGRSYTLAGNPRKGLQILKKAFSLNPTESKIIFELGVLYDLLGDKRNATFCYSRLINNFN
ncbi:MAG TPA: tetratricopeptide repeat protein [Firmicutes bacterium]|jgi:tetratricopeptide (TPR) repeat protein|nr:tetratricopeptide repeat protein [Bacillota bacterium]